MVSEMAKGKQTQGEDSQSVKVRKARVVIKPGKHRDGKVRTGRRSGAEDMRTRPWDEFPVARVPDVNCEPCQGARLIPWMLAEDEEVRQGFEVLGWVKGSALGM